MSPVFHQVPLVGPVTDIEAVVFALASPFAALLIAAGFAAFSNFSEQAGGVPAEE
jgi:hypothetical protein